MAVYSMTGYATATVNPPSAGETGTNSGGVTVEMRSVNGRFLDLSFRLPDEMRQLEPWLREQLSAGLRRGKVEVRVALRRDHDDSLPSPPSELLNRLARVESSVTGWLPKARPLSVNEVMQWCRGASVTLGAEVDEIARQAATAAIDELKQARAREGDRLVSMLLERIAGLRELAKRAAPLVPAVVERQQQRFLERWMDALKQAGQAGGGTVSEEAARERALTEAAAYAIRIDVAEELSRLGAHLEEIQQLLKKGGELGKRLDFLIQELHREANTLGSKSAALELTAISVEMKVLIEQMREQVQNIE